MDPFGFLFACQINLGKLPDSKGRLKAIEYNDNYHNAPVAYPIQIND